MWEINYESPTKLWMSIGAGIVVAGFLLFLTSTWNTFGAVDKFTDKIHEDISNCNLQNSTYNELSKNLLDLRTNQKNAIVFLMIITYILSFLFIVIGGIIFHCNYNKFKEEKRK